MEELVGRGALQGLAPFEFACPLKIAGIGSEINRIGSAGAAL
jgi:hypothetical protein